MEDMIPQGFEPHFRKPKFTEPWEPIYSRVDDDQVRLGVMVREVHCNTKGVVHGGFLATLADYAIGLCVGRGLEEIGREHTGIATASLNIDYLGRAGVGDWIHTDVDVIKLGSTLCTANCIVVSADGPVARANATFRVF